MNTLIVNVDTEKDSFTSETLTSITNTIRNFNAGTTTYFYVFDPYHESQSMANCDNAYMFIRSDVYNGIYGMAAVDRELYKYRSYDAVDIYPEILINPTWLPILSLDTLVAYMPHINWDEFGNHLVLTDNDADMLDTLWKTFVQQRSSLFKAISDGHYFLPDDRSILEYIYIK